MQKIKRNSLTVIQKIAFFLILFVLICLGLSLFPFFTTDQIDCNISFFPFLCKLFQSSASTESQDQQFTEISIEQSATPEEQILQKTIPPKNVTSTASPSSTNTQTITPSPTKTITPTLVTQNVHFIASYGNDANSGTLYSPWKSLQYAASHISAGDTLYIRAGTYQETVIWDVNGEENAPITIMNYPGETVIIDGYDTIPASSGGFYLFTIRGNWYTISGLEIKNSYGEGGVLVKGTHVAIKDCYVHHNWGGGITITGDYGLAQNNRIWYNGRSNEFSSMQRGGWPAAITCARYPSYCTLKDNITWENWGEGISTFEAYYSTLEGNVSFNNLQNIYISDTMFSIIQGNFAYCTPGNIPGSHVSTQNGILVGDEKQNPPSSSNQIINNIVYGCNRNLAIGTNESNNSIVANNVFVNAVDDSIESANVYFYAGSCTNCLFVNNLILQENDILIGNNYGIGWELSNNLWSVRPLSSLRGKNDIIGDPLLIKDDNPYSLGWYQLQSDSPAMNNAIHLDQVLLDFSGVTRANIPDIGAFEYLP